MKLKFKLDGKVDHKILFKKLKDISIVGENNEVSFLPFEYDILEWTFLSLINFDNIHSIESKKHILFFTFKQLILDNKLDLESFNYFLNYQITHFDKKEETTFFLLASLSVKELSIRKIDLGYSQIYLTGKKFPLKFLKHRNSLIKTQKENSLENEYLKVVVKIKASDYKEGFEKAYQSLELFRAMLCLLLNSSIELRFGSHSLNPINKVRQGQFSSLHLEDGTCANNYCWHDPYFMETKSFEVKPEKLAKIKTNLKWLLNKYNLCSEKHKNSLNKALNLYVNAFDESNKYICFIRAWTALENILSTDQNELVIKRSIALYHKKDRPYEKQILEGLRKYRNEFVHKGESSLDPFVACFKIQEYIFNLIVRFNFKYAGLFHTIDESTLFLDNYNNADITDLKSKRKIIDLAISLKEKHLNS